jgi:hypothetical protein
VGTTAAVTVAGRPIVADIVVVVPVTVVVVAVAVVVVAAAGPRLASQLRCNETTKLH